MADATLEPAAQHPISFQDSTPEIVVDSTDPLLGSTQKSTEELTSTLPAIPNRRPVIPKRPSSRATSVASDNAPAIDSPDPVSSPEIPSVLSPIPHVPIRRPTPRRPGSTTPSDYSEEPNSQKRSSVVDGLEAAVFRTSLSSNVSLDSGVGSASTSPVVSRTTSISDQGSANASTTPLDAAPSNPGTPVIPARRPPRKTASSPASSTSLSADEASTPSTSGDPISNLPKIVEKEDTALAEKFEGTAFKNQTEETIPSIPDAVDTNSELLTDIPKEDAIKHESVETPAVEDSEIQLEEKASGAEDIGNKEAETNVPTQQIAGDSSTEEEKSEKEIPSVPDRPVSIPPRPSKRPVGRRPPQPPRSSSVTSSNEESITPTVSEDIEKEIAADEQQKVSSEPSTTTDPEPSTLPVKSPPIVHKPLSVGPEGKHPPPIMPKRPQTKHTLSSDLVSSMAGNSDFNVAGKKAPPSIPNRPPKLGSKVQAMAAGMFGAPGSTDSDKPRSHPAIPPKPNKPILAPKPPINIGGGGAASKVSALRASLSKDLGNMFSRGGVPPPSMAAIVTGIKEESDEEGLDGDEINERALKKQQEKVDNEEEKEVTTQIAKAPAKGKLADARRGRAKGPKRKLPTASVLEKEDDKSSNKAFVVQAFESWSIGGKIDPQTVIVGNGIPVVLKKKKLEEKESELDGIEGQEKTNRQSERDISETPLVKEKLPVSGEEKHDEEIPKEIITPSTQDDQFVEEPVVTSNVKEDEPASAPILNPQSDIVKGEPISEIPIESHVSSASPRNSEDDDTFVDVKEEHSAEIQNPSPSGHPIDSVESIPHTSSISPSLENDTSFPSRDVQPVSADSALIPPTTEVEDEGYKPDRSLSDRISSIEREARSLQEALSGSDFDEPAIGGASTSASTDSHLFEAHAPGSTSTPSFVDNSLQPTTSAHNGAADIPSQAPGFTPEPIEAEQEADDVTFIKEEPVNQQPASLAPPSTASDQEDGDEVVITQVSTSN